MKKDRQLTIAIIISAIVIVVVAGFIGLLIREVSNRSADRSRNSSGFNSAGADVQESESTAPLEDESNEADLIDQDKAAAGSSSLGVYTDKFISKGNNPKPTYMVYYGKLSFSAIQIAKLYDVVILHPKGGDITRDQVKEIQDSGTTVLGYISIGEDLRTENISPEDMLKDNRFTGDGTGPRIDPRKNDEEDFNELDIKGIPSDGGTGFASYYLDDNDHDGMPDRNPYFYCAYTNIGDPAWHEVLENMVLDIDGAPGIREIVTTDYGRGLGCDGIFMDTIDTAAPNSFTQDTDEFRTRFEWTAPGLLDFTSDFKSRYPDKYLLQNRGLFYYNKELPHYKVNAGKYIDFLMYESFRLDSSPERLFYDTYFLENLYIYGPMVAAEAGRPDGFTVLSLGYAEGPQEYNFIGSLMEISYDGREDLLEDIRFASEVMGFSHYITNGSLTLANSFVLDNQSLEDTTPPQWSSVYTQEVTYPASPTVPRYGIGEVSYDLKGLLVKWDVALDRSGVDYYLYYQEGAFDFENDPELKNSVKIKLEPGLPKEYGDPEKPDAYPYQQLLTDIKLNSGKEYYFAIRAQDRSPAGNSEKNTYYCTLIAESDFRDSSESSDTSDSSDPDNSNDS